MDSGIENMLRVSEKRGQFTTEASFEKFICDTIIKKHLDGLHFKVTGYKGIPDRFVLPNNFIEFKTVFHGKGKIPIHKGLTTAQRQWAKDIHAHGGRSWFCVLLQNNETYEKNVYFEPAFWSLWAHDAKSYGLKTYYKHQLLVPSETEQVKDHIWERLETDYYEQSCRSAGNSKKAKGVTEDDYALQRHSNRLAP